MSILLYHLSCVIREEKDLFVNMAPSACRIILKEIEISLLNLSDFGFGYKINKASAKVSTHY